MTDPDKANYDELDQLIHKPFDLKSLKRAELLAAEMNDSDYRAWSFSKLARAYLANELADDAERVASLIPTPYEKARELRSIAAALSKNSPNRTITILQQVQCVAETIEIIIDRADALAPIGQLLFEAGAVEQAEEAWRKAITLARAGETDPDKQRSLDASGILYEISLALTSLKRMPQARTIALAIKNPAKRDKALRDINSLYSSQR